MKSLITGGAGFIGSKIARKLIEDNIAVRIIDSLDPQIHGKNPDPPKWLLSETDFIEGDIRNKSLLEKHLDDIDIIFHMAASTGVGQSMYKITDYCDVNISGTATLLEAVQSHLPHIRKFICPSSRAIYGEGAYHCPSCSVLKTASRRIADLERHRWEPICPTCSTQLLSVPTNEDFPANPLSVYAVTKYSQELLLKQFSNAFDMPLAICRYFNVYGPGQSLKNPYTGVLTTFQNRIFESKEINVFEDGQESRDFIYIDDLVRATLKAALHPVREISIFNIGSGEPVTLINIADELIDISGKQCNAAISGHFRVGDIRHCTADTSKAGRILGWKNTTSLADGLRTWYEWASENRQTDTSEEALSELKKFGLYK